MGDNPQAFPCLDGSDGELSMRDPGMTLRDWFAGQALAALASTSLGKGLEPEVIAKVIAEGCYMTADAMLAERSK